MSAQVFIDETKQRGYLLVASVVVPSDLDSVRQVLRGMVLPGQRRLHMKDESESRKRSIATAIAVSGVTATIYDAGRPGCGGMVLGHGRRLAPTHRIHRHRRARSLTGHRKREARAPRSSGRVSGSLPEAQRNRLRSV